jgi:FAD/FMN-containing dehydrogenase
MIVRGAGAASLCLARCRGKHQPPAVRGNGGSGMPASQHGVAVVTGLHHTLAMSADHPIASLRRAYAGLLHVDAEAKAPFLTDWRRRYRGEAWAVAQPGNTDEVAAILAWCQAEGVPVVPQGGNTGLSGGATPDASGAALLLSLARMCQVRSCDAANATLTVEAGCTLATVQAAAVGAGLLFPLSLASEGSCTIGGNLATNAGGVHVLRYGNARALCLGIEAVLADGRVWHGLSGLRKDNSGYDLRDLLIGSEGTLGVITAATLRLFAQPAGRALAWVAVPSADAALALLARAAARLDQDLNAFELVSAQALDLVLAHIPGTQAPLSEVAPWSVLVEATAHDEAGRAEAMLQTLLADALAAGEITDAVLATNARQMQALWRLRESISTAQGIAGRNVKHDIALPRSAVPSFVAEVGARIRAAWPGAVPVVFGHLGDGNLHYNLSPPPDRVDGDDLVAFTAFEGEVNTLVHAEVMARGGSLSAEHGLGILRRDAAARYRDPAADAAMRAIKQALDPKGLLNPGKVL